MRIFSAAIIAAVTLAMDDMEWTAITLDSLTDSGSDGSASLADGPNAETSITGRWKCSTGEDGTKSLDLEWTFNWDAAWEATKTNKITDASLFWATGDASAVVDGALSDTAVLSFGVGTAGGADLNTPEVA